ncbi:MAG: DUF3301 domain-containing protein [Gammaproteobacteria bacterium]
MAEAITTLLLLVGAVWFWSDSLQARERALNRCRKACDELCVQLLDETVALSRITLNRNPRGRLSVHRWYRFEFSTDGTDRHPGAVSLTGQIIEFVRLEHPQGPLIMPAGTLHGIGEDTRLKVREGDSDKLH